MLKRLMARLSGRQSPMDRDDAEELRWRIRRVLGMHGVNLPLESSPREFETALCNVIEDRGEAMYRDELRDQRQVIPLSPTPA